MKQFDLNLKTPLILLGHLHTLWVIWDDSGTMDGKVVFWGEFVIFGGAIKILSRVSLLKMWAEFLGAQNPIWRPAIFKITFSTIWLTTMGGSWFKPDMSVATILQNAFVTVHDEIWFWPLTSRWQSSGKCLPFWRVPYYHWNSVALDMDFIWMNQW